MSQDFWKVLSPRSMTQPMETFPIHLIINLKSSSIISYLKSASRYVFLLSLVQPRSRIWSLSFHWLIRHWWELEWEWNIHSQFLVLPRASLCFTTFVVPGDTLLFSSHIILFQQRTSLSC